MKPRPSLFALALVGLVACGEPPAKEIAAAETQIEEARKENADRYAADRLKEATTALEAARSKVQQKDYKGALSAANDASDKARAAKIAAATAKTLARGAAETAMTEVGVALEEIEAIRQEAAKAKVPEEAFADLLSKVDEVRQAQERVSDTLAKGDVLEAQKAASELKAQVTALPVQFREAQEKWIADHPAKGRRKKA